MAQLEQQVQLSDWDAALGIFVARILWILCAKFALVEGHLKFDSIFFQAMDRRLGGCGILESQNIGIHGKCPK